MAIVIIKEAKEEVRFFTQETAVYVLCETTSQW